MKGRITLHLLLADCTSVDAILECQSLLKMLLTMLSHVVNDPVRLRHSLEFTTGTGKLLALLRRMTRCHMNRQTLRLEKALLTDSALKGRLALVTLHMVVHGILILLHSLAGAANKETLCVLLICVRHGSFKFRRRPGFNFLVRALPKSWRQVPRRMIIATLAIGEDFKRSLAPALESKAAYAKRHGYTYVQGGKEFWDRTKPIAWSKVPLMLQILRDASEGALIFLSDADVMITNPDLRLEDHVVPLLENSKDLLMTLDACNNLNSGNMLLRNTDWQRDFWRRVGEQRDLTYHIWWENAAIIKLLYTNPADSEKIQITEDCRRFNAYLEGAPGKPTWAPGDFLVHFAGTYDLKKMEELQRTVKSRI